MINDVIAIAAMPEICSVKMAEIGTLCLNLLCCPVVVPFNRSVRGLYPALNVFQILFNFLYSLLFTHF